MSPGSLLLSPDSKPLRAGTYLAFLFVYKVRVLLFQPNMGVKEEVVCDPPAGTACWGVGWAFYSVSHGRVTEEMNSSRTPY